MSFLEAREPPTLKKHLLVDFLGKEYQQAANSKEVLIVWKKSIYRLTWKLPDRFPQHTACSRSEQWRWTTGNQPFYIEINPLNVNYVTGSNESRRSDI